MAKEKFFGVSAKLSSFKKYRNDAVLVLIFLLIALSVWVVFSVTAQKGNYVVVIKDGTETEKYPLSEELSVDISSSENGINRLTIKNGEAKIIFANCRDLICVNHKGISKVGETIVCLPHKLVIKIVNESSNSLDMTA